MFIICNVHALSSVKKPGPNQFCAIADPATPTCGQSGNPSHPSGVLAPPMSPHPETWLKVLPDGLYCEPGGFYIDPPGPVGRAIITHAHADHARPGHGAVLASPETMALMDIRMGAGRSGVTRQILPYGETVTLDGVRVWLQPADHVLGSAQVAMEWQGSRTVVSGDYKRVRDPTCRPFEPIACDVFVSEATFGLPVFRHPPPEDEVARLLQSVQLFPERTHVV